MPSLIHAALVEARRLGAGRLVCAAVAVAVFSPLGAPVQGALARGGGLGLALVPVSDVLCLVVAARALQSPPLAALAATVVMLPALSGLGSPESGPGWQLLLTYKWTLASLAGWVGLLREGGRRRHWVAALVPTLLAGLMLALVFVPM